MGMSWWAKVFAQIVLNSCRRFILAWWDILDTQLNTQLPLQNPKEINTVLTLLGPFKTEIPSLGKTTRLVAAAKPNCSEHCQRQFCKQQQTQATIHSSSLQQQQQSIMNLYHWHQLLEPSKPKLADMQLLVVPPN